MTTDRIDDLLCAHFAPAAAPADLAERVLAQARGTAKSLAWLGDRLQIEATPRGVARVGRGHVARPRDAAARRLVAQARTQLAEYLAGTRAFFSVPVDLSGVGRFQRRVLEAAARIPFGEVRSYAWIAREVGHPRAVRAVGTALGRNPVPLIIPCHRVLRSDGAVGGYGLGGGPVKRRLLALERRTPTLEGCTTTHVVCRVGCPHGRRMRPENRVVFASVGDARAVGYRPCRSCRPAA
jgi:O-6-methylguanine DNA methyltransferase